MSEFRALDRYPRRTHGQILILVLPSHEPAITRSIISAGYSATVAKDWLTCERVLQAQSPDGWIISADMVTNGDAHLIERLRRNSTLGPTALLFDRIDGALLSATWPLAAMGVQVMRMDATLSSQVQTLVQADMTQIVSHLTDRFGGSEGIRDLLLALSSQKGRLRSRVGEIALAARMSRSHLYRVLRHHQLPAIEQFQFLLRLLPAMQAYQRSGNADRAARMAGLADATTFRRAILKRFRLRLRDVRECGNWRTWIEHWIGHNCDDIYTASSSTSGATPPA